jgi:tRNA nucleotidyltransferase (CCA-adding enzyme)
MQKDDVLRLFHNPDLIPSMQQNLLSDIAALAASLNMPCYVVGGFVRDLLLGRPVKDLDVIVEGDAVKLGDQLIKKYGGKLTPHFKFRTAFWHVPNSDQIVDLITARSETYERSGVLPLVTPSTIEEDLRRRDFTINAMAIRLDGEHFGELLDPLNGQSDLEHGSVRVLHERSFVDDPTRIFRAIRYEGRYGFKIEASTLKYVNSEAFYVLASLSGERLRNELDLIFDEADAVKIMKRAENLGLWKYIHPHMPEFDQARAIFLEMDNRLDIPADRRTMGYMLWFMDLSEEDISLLVNRLDFSNELSLSVWAAAQLKRGLPHLTGSTPSVWTYALEKLPLISIYAVYLVAREDFLLRYISLWRHVKPHTTGNDLRDRGLVPGPRYGDILTRLRAAWLDGEVVDKEGEVRLLESMI